MRKTIVCLANSYKHGGRCVAGVCVEDGRWVRLRGKAADGALELAEYWLDDGTEVRLLDAIEVELHYGMTSNCHPEDWVVAAGKWVLVERPVGSAYWKELAKGEKKVQGILRDSRDRVAEWELKYRPMKSSLTLLCPTDVWWWVRDERGKRKCRAVFRKDCVTYDLALTDPKWIERLNMMPVGMHPHSKFVADGSETWFTVSLSEAFHGFHYKLVAAVIVREK